MKKIITTIVCFALVFVFASSSLAGSGIPTATTTLPYTASSGSGIYSYTYTNYKFKPASANKITVAFTGNCSSIVNYTLKLYSSSTVTEQPTTMVIMMNRTGSVSASNAWSSLNSATYYYGYMGKTDNTVRAAVTGKYS